MLFFSHEKEFWRRQFMAERCLHRIPREPDFFHFLVLPSLKYGFLLMDREAFQTPPSPFVPAIQAQAGGRDENGLPSAFKLFPKSCKLRFFSYALGHHLVTWPRLHARKAGILDQAATTNTIDWWLISNRTVFLIVLEAGRLRQGTSTVRLSKNSFPGGQLLVPLHRGEQKGAWSSLITLTRALIPFMRPSSSLLCYLVTQSCPTLCDPMDCSLPGSSVHGILQARILESWPHTILSTFQRSYLLNSSHGGVIFQHINFGTTQTFSPYQLGNLLYCRYTGKIGSIIMERGDEWILRGFATYFWRHDNTSFSTSKGFFLLFERNSKDQQERNP